MGAEQMQPAAKNQAVELRAYLNSKSVLAELQAVLPKSLSASRLVRQTLTLAQRQPKLLECTPISILAGLVQAAELGLEMSGPLGHAYLVPRWNSKRRLLEATFQVGYRGLLELAYRSGKVSNLSLRTVHEKDVFLVQYGSKHQIIHEPCLQGNAGEVVAYYALVQLLPTGSDFEVMSKEAVVAHRAKYSPPGKGESAWDTSFDEMALKTVCRKLAKRLPLSVEFQSAAATDEIGEKGVAENSVGFIQVTRSEQVLAQLEHDPGVVVEQPVEVEVTE